MISVRFVPFIIRHVVRERARTVLTVGGIAIAMFLFTAVQAMHRGVDEATRRTADDTTLIVYRKDRYCPMTSQLPQDYVGRIARVDGVASVMPVRVVVNNCRTSLDVVTFRGVPKDEFLADRDDDITLVAGSFDEWRRRTDAALVGETLAARRGLKPGMMFDAAGITVYVAAIMRSSLAQDQNVAYTALEFVQLAGRDGLGVVTQFNVKVASSDRLDAVAAEIDAIFDRDRAPTATFTEQAFVGRLADDVIELVGFARWLGLGCLVAILALVGNAIVLSVQGRIAEHAVLQTIGYRGGLIARLIVAEAVLLALVGGVIGGATALVVARIGSFALSVEGLSIPVVASPTLLVTGLGICAALGAAAGLVPAVQASRRHIASCFRAA